MISIDVLNDVRRIITHAHCPDGMASAIILHDALPKASVSFMLHDEIAVLPAERGMLFCDIAPSVRRATEFANLGAVVLDHHRTQAASVEACGTLGVYADETADPGVSGALLAFRHVWLPMLDVRYPASFSCEVEDNKIRTRNAERFAILAGVRDTFQKNHNLWDVAWDLASALMFRSAETLLRLNDPFSICNEFFWDEQERLGHEILMNTRRRAAQAIQEGFRFKVNGKSILIVQGVELTTTIGEIVGSRVDLIAGFSYRCTPSGEHRFQVSMRSQGIVDVSKVAKAFGGGGHTSAAGFTCDAIPVSSPLAFIIEALRDVGV